MSMQFRLAMRATLVTAAVTMSTACHNDPAGPGRSSTGDATHPAGSIEAQRPVGARPYAVAIGPDGRVLVGQLDNAQLVGAVLPSTTFSQAIQAGRTPTDIALNAAGDRGSWRTSTTTLSR